MFGSDRFPHWTKRPDGWFVHVEGYCRHFAPHQRGKEWWKRTKPFGRKIPIGRNLASTHPDIAQEWHYEYNGAVKTVLKLVIDIRVTIATFVIIANRREHVGSTGYFSEECMRAMCEFLCGGSSGRALRNSQLKQHHGFIGGLCPQHVTRGSNIRVWWRCHKGHAYSATPHHRTVLGSGCPQCRMSKAEYMFSTMLENQGIRYQFNYPLPINTTCVIESKKRQYVDFMLFCHSIAVEIDGAHHYEAVTFGNDSRKPETRFIRQKQLDKEKNRIISHLGCQIIRIPVHDTRCPKIWNQRFQDAIFNIKKCNRSSHPPVRQNTFFLHEST